MSTAVAKNLMAEMKLLGMLGAFDKIKRTLQPALAA